MAKEVSNQSAAPAASNTDLLDSAGERDAASETRAADSEAIALGSVTSNRATTVLPRVELHGAGPTFVLQSRTRYEDPRPLGQGSMGDVSLVKDNDIQRLAAMKRLKAKRMDAGALGARPSNA